jgi:hypothetical protein
VIQEVMQLVNEELHSPEVHISVLLWEVRGASISELIVKNNGYIEETRKLGKDVEVFVG